MLLLLSPLGSWFSQAARWCDEGIYLLASQPVDRCQSHEGAQAALQDLEQYLGTAGKNLLADHNAVCTQYEMVLTQELRVNTLLTLLILTTVLV